MPRREGVNPLGKRQRKRIPNPRPGTPITLIKGIGQLTRHAIRIGFRHLHLQKPLKNAQTLRVKNGPQFFARSSLFGPVDTTRRLVPDRRL